ncbi:hypothetical protein cyc_00376 [Cyclospora cayetanensis]|uniref:Uncharacterized protein n=1 Tax=Cyclospora cayetanensis TaxID=88456 RepID=A0A1D3CXT4_9EIME|nr:hypothetical protein cyc_00376 [Cyclospora cayetanensis]
MYIRWAGPDFRKFIAKRQADGDTLPRLCMRVQKDPDILERRAVCRALCERLEYEQELLTAHLAASFCYMAYSGTGNQLTALAMDQGRQFLRASMRKLHKAHFPLCERPSSVTQRLVEVVLQKAEDDLEHAKAKIGPLPFRQPRPHDRGARERQLCLLPPEGTSEPPNVIIQQQRPLYPLPTGAFSASLY